MVTERTASRLAWGVFGLLVVLPFWLGLVADTMQPATLSLWLRRPQ